MPTGISATPAGISIPRFAASFHRWVRLEGGSLRPAASALRGRRLGPTARFVGPLTVRSRMLPRARPLGKDLDLLAGG